MNARKKWTRQESIVALNLYYRLPFGQYHSRNEKVIELAELLDRTPGSVAMKLCNFAALDPGLKRTGLENVSALDVEIWDEFQSNSKKLFEESEILLDELKRKRQSKKTKSV